MLDILSPPWPNVRSSINFPRLNYNRDKLKQNWNKSKYYYRSSSNYAQSNHIVIQILSSITFDRTQTPYQYYNCLDEAEYYFASIHGIVNDINNAKALLNGYFYGGKKSIEIYVLDTNDVDINSDWQSWEPIKLKHSNFIDYSFSIPERGNIQNDAEGFNIISINIKMLAMQYYYYLKSNTDMLIGDTKRNIGSFVVRYPLCNMLPSVIDCSFINEFRKILIGTNIHSIKETNPIALNTHNYMFEKTIYDIIRTYHASRSYDIVTALVSMPVIFAKNPLDVYNYHHYLTNINNIWVIAYLQYTILLIGYELASTKAINSPIFKKLIHEVKIINNSNYIYSGSKALSTKINDTINLFIKLIN